MDFLPFLVTMLSTAVVYGLFALSVVFAYRMSRILFMCIGEIGMVTAYVFTFAWSAAGAGFAGLLLAALAALATSLVIGAVLWLVLAAERRRDHFLGTVITIAVAIILLGLMTMLWGGTVEQMPLRNMQIRLGDISFSSNGLITILVGGVTILVVLGLFYRTSFGVGLQALAANRGLAALSGVPVRRHEFFAWTGASLISGIAGILFGLTSAVSVDGAVVGFSGMIAAIIGGLTSPGGALAGALLLAAGEGVISLFFDLRYAIVVPVLALTLLLAIRPRGLSARVETIERT